MRELVGKPLDSPLTASRRATLGNIMKSMVALSLASLLAFTSIQSRAQGTVIAGHFGANDPTIEGFTLVQSGNPSLGPVLGDLGVDAWAIGLDSNADMGGYFRNLTAQQGSLGGGGWTLSLTLRILEPFNSANGGIFSSLYTGSEYFILMFGAQPSGDPVLLLQGISYDLSGVGSGYHNYQLRNDVATGATSFWVDGAPFLTEVAGSPNPTTASFSWGGGQHPPGSAYANWNEASLSVIPEPSSLLLLSFGGLFLAAARALTRAKRVVKTASTQTSAHTLMQVFPRN